MLIGYGEELIFEEPMKERDSRWISTQTFFLKSSLMQMHAIGAEFAHWSTPKSVQQKVARPLRTKPIVGCEQMSNQKLTLI
jgi:hypothetical protein